MLICKFILQTQQINCSSFWYYLTVFKQWITELFKRDIIEKDYFKSTQVVKEHEAPWLLEGSQA